jgi:hypothetical protein
MSLPTNSPTFSQSARIPVNLFLMVIMIERGNLVYSHYTPAATAVWL